MWLNINFSKLTRMLLGCQWIFMGISVDIWGDFCIERQKIVVKIYFNLIVIRNCHFSIEIIVINLIFMFCQRLKKG